MRVSSYADLVQGPAEVRVLRGNLLCPRGRGALAADLAEQTSARTVHCLGHCDRSPALLRRDGRVVLPGPRAGATRALAEPAGTPASTSVRARSPERIVTRRLGRGGFAELGRARADGAYAALERTLRRPPEAVLAAIEASGLRGRGGAAFPTGQKWRRAAAAAGDVRYVVANGDEGDPGSFVDRLLMEEDPHGVLEGMALCAYAVGAREGIAFVRSEYPAASTALRRAVIEARAAGILGESVLGSGFAFDIRVVSGLRQLRVRRGDGPARGPRGPPLRGAPAPAVPRRGWASRAADGRGQRRDPRQRGVGIVERGPDAYAALGTAASPGMRRSA